MATTQYIGARYVPKIYDNPDDNTNNWKQGVEYEPLTMVSYAGGSYTSKTTVPSSAANPADAPQYWAYMGSSSAQITTNTNNISRIQHALANATESGYICTSARNENDFVWIDGTLYICTAPISINDSYTEGINIKAVIDTMAAINQMKSDLVDASNDIDNINDDIANINDDIANINDDIATIETKLSNPYTLMIGDSYAQGYDPGGNNNGWCNYLMNMGITGEYIAAGGSCFGLSESDTRSPMYLLQNATLQVPDDEVGRIIICEGYNDFFKTSSTVTTNAINFINYCSNRFPNSKIYLGMCGYAWTHNEDSAYGSIMIATARAYAAACYNTKAIFMAQVLGVLLGCNGLSTSDYKHPNENGNKNIASAIWAAINGNDYITNHYYSLSFSNSSINASATLGLDISVQNGIVTGRSKINPFSIDNSTAVSLGSIPLDNNHAPIIPGVSFIGSTIVHNYDKASGISKSFYNSSFTWTLGMNSNMHLLIRSNLINDIGNNFAESKHVEFNDAATYQINSSFV